MKALFLLFLLGSTALASFPPKLNVTLKEKMSCREIKRVFYKARLFINCNNKSGLLQSFSAEYFGREYQAVLREFRKLPKVKEIEG